MGRAHETLALLQSHTSIRRARGSMGALVTRGRLCKLRASVSQRLSSMVAGCCLADLLGNVIIICRPNEVHVLVILVRLWTGKTINNRIARGCGQSQDRESATTGHR